MPKCPACLAAYIALFSGVGLTMATATNLRTTLIVLSIAALLLLITKQLCRLTRRV